MAVGGSIHTKLISGHAPANDRGGSGLIHTGGPQSQKSITTRHTYQNQAVSNDGIHYPAFMNQQTAAAGPLYLSESRETAFSETLNQKRKNSAEKLPKISIESK